MTPAPERAFLIAVDTGSDVGWPAEDSLQELASLARTAGAEVVGAEWQQRRHPDPDTYIGAGKAQELLAAKIETGFTILIADDELSPTQQRGLEEVLGVKVIDRSRLILDIFALHARTREGRLQVELAQLEYQLPRLTKLWTHLSRTGGGIGTRGPGESQLETDRRLIRDRISVMKARVDQVRRSRETGAKSRTTRGEPTVAIVGYTNAGKSTLLNSLVGSSVVLAEDRLFATLDPTSRRVRLPGGLNAIVTDTVGFIHKLPHQLVDAFRATLEEVSRADLLLEVVDASDHHALEHRATVQAVLDELGAAEKPRMIAANKIDAAQMHAREISPAALGVSAATGLGLGPLRSALEEALQRQGTPVDLRLPYTAVGEVEAIRARGGIQVAYDEDALHVTGFATAELASELKRLKRNTTAKLL
jgi:GTP-binding protein HflX